MYISAKVDYAVRALCTLAEADGRRSPPKRWPARRAFRPKFLESILNDMRRAGLLSASGGPRAATGCHGRHRTITVADVIRPLDGPLAEVRGLRPEAATYEGAAEHLQSVWVAVRASLRAVLESVTIADIVSGKLPRSVQKLTGDPEAWLSR